MNDAITGSADSWPTDDWFESLAQGDPDVEAEFWQKYGEPLQRVAQRQISQSLGKRVDAEDIVQSACRTFFRRVRQGEFQCEDSGDLWRLMLTITLNKARMQARFHSRGRRAMNREQVLGANDSAMSGGVEEAIEAVDFADFLESIFNQLDHEQGEILRRLLDEQTQEEIAKAVGCSDRTVRRMKDRIRESLHDILQSQLLS